MDTLTDEQMAELQRLRGYFPFRIVYGARRGSEWEAGAVTTMRHPNRLARDGWTVVVVK